MLLERAIQIDPTQPESHNNSGNALLALGRTLEALACYDQAIRLRPAYAEAHANRADVLKRLADWMRRVKATTKPSGLIRLLWQRTLNWVCCSK